jgi:hypothetical protein
MTIPVKKEKKAQGERSVPESCAICCRDSAYWTDLPDRSQEQQVACCRRCAKYNSPRDVPTKLEWLTRGDEKARRRCAGPAPRTYPEAIARAAPRKPSRRRPPRVRGSALLAVCLTNLRPVRS